MKKILSTLTQFNGAGRATSRGCLQRVAIATAVLSLIALALLIRF